MMLRDVRLKDVMKTPVITALIDDPFSVVEEKFRIKGIRHLPVVDNVDRLVGLITQRDLYRIISPRISDTGNIYYDAGMLNTFILRHVMIPDPLALTPDDFFATAVELMARHKYGCVPLIDSARKIAGIITETDVLKIFAKCLLSKPGLL